MFLKLSTRQSFGGHSFRSTGAGVIATLYLSIIYILMSLEAKIPARKVRIFYQDYKETERGFEHLFAEK